MEQFVYDDTYRLIAQYEELCIVEQSPPCLISRRIDCEEYIDRFVPWSHSQSLTIVHCFEIFILLIIAAHKESIRICEASSFLQYDFFYVTTCLALLSESSIEIEINLNWLKYQWYCANPCRGNLEITFLFKNAVGLQ